MLRSRFDSPGLYCLDEPEAALSFSRPDGAGRHAARTGRGRCPGALRAGHSPLLAALPGAHLLEVGEWGVREAAYDDLDLVRHWRAYLAEPMRYLRHVL